VARARGRGAWMRARGCVEMCCIARVRSSSGRRRVARAAWAWAWALGFVKALTCAMRRASGVGRRATRCLCGARASDFMDARTDVFVPFLLPHTVHLRCHELRTQSKSELMQALKEYKQELAALRVAKVTNGAPGKLSKIKSVRLAIAQTLTVIRQNQLKSLREAYSGSKYLPLDLRTKKTRAIRRALTKSEKGAKTVRQAKKDAAFPQRKYALKA